MNDLNPELRRDAAFFIVSDEVRCHPIFVNLPNGALEQLCALLKKVHARAGEKICKVGESGLSMYIIVSGEGVFDDGHQYVADDSNGGWRPTAKLQVGDSFG